MSDSPALAVLVVLGPALHISTSSRWAEDGGPAPTSVATVTPDGPGPEPFRVTVCPQCISAIAASALVLISLDRGTR